MKPSLPTVAQSFMSSVFYLVAGCLVNVQARAREGGIQTTRRRVQSQHAARGRNSLNDHLLPSCPNPASQEARLPLQSSGRQTFSQGASPFTPALDSSRRGFRRSLNLALPPFDPPLPSKRWPQSQPSTTSSQTRPQQTKTPPTSTTEHPAGEPT